MTKKQSEMLTDIRTIEQIARKYSGAEGAYLTFIANEEGGMQISLGGRADIMGITLSEAIAKFIMITPGLGKEFIDNVHYCVKEMIKDQEGPVQ